MLLVTGHLDQDTGTGTPDMQWRSNCFCRPPPLAVDNSLTSKFQKVLKIFIFMELQGSNFRLLLLVLDFHLITVGYSYTIQSASKNCRKASNRLKIYKQIFRAFISAKLLITLSKFSPSASSLSMERTAKSVSLVIADRRWALQTRKALRA